MAPHDAAFDPGAYANRRIRSLCQQEFIMKNANALAAAFGLALSTLLPMPAAAVESVGATTDLRPELINPSALKWEKTIPALGKDSPEYAILHSDPQTQLTTLMFRTPIAVHIKPHTHDLAETHVVLVGGTHVFESNGVRYNVENGGFFRMPGGVVHEAWLPAGSQTLNILESGWVVNWLHGGPAADDANKYPPVSGK
jgi:AraC-like ligand binding domain